MEIENAVYVDYADHVHIDEDYILVAAWNKFLIFKGVGNKIFSNDSEFFEKNFRNSYDAAWAVSIGNWRWSDSFVYIDEAGLLTSFSHWNDENSPIDIDKIDVSHLINSLKKWRKK